MASKLFQALLKHKLINIPADMKPEDQSKIELDFEDLEKAFAATQPKPAATEKKETVGEGPVDVSALIEALKGPLADMLKPIQEQINTVTQYTSTQQKAKQDADAAATQKRYADHVDKLVKDGKLTKAEGDKYKDPASDESKKATSALDIWIESSDRWAVNPTFRPAAAPVAKGADGNAATVVSPLQNERDLEAAALAEIAASAK